MKAEHLFHFLDVFLGIHEVPDYSAALNGLQVEGPEEVQRIAVAVDASEETLRRALEVDVDALLVHHGLFWAGLVPLTGAHLRKVRVLLSRPMALYSAHLPLDAHPDVGNAAVLSRTVGLEVQGTFGSHKGVEIGCRGTFPGSMEELVARLGSALGGPVREILEPGTAPSDPAGAVAVVTGAGAGFLAEAQEKGIRTLVTGEAPHHAYHEARERGVNLLLGGHYATETFGVRALGETLEELYGLPWTFIDVPTGL